MTRLMDLVEKDYQFDKYDKDPIKKKKKRKKKEDMLWNLAISKALSQGQHRGKYVTLVYLE